MTYRLICPKCGQSDLLVKSEDLLDDGEFLGDPVVGCLECGKLMRLSECEMVETGDNGVLHMEGGDES